jgi:hypothetical protein
MYCAARRAASKMREMSDEPHLYGETTSVFAKVKDKLASLTRHQNDKRRRSAAQVQGTQTKEVQTQGRSFSSIFTLQVKSCGRRPLESRPSKSKG